MERTTDIVGVLGQRDFSIGSFTTGVLEGQAFSTSITGGVLDSFALGTAIREGSVFANSPENPVPLTEDEYKNSQFFRKELPFSEGLTEHRAAALAEFIDAKNVRDTKLENTPGWAAKIAGSIIGQAFDPINYIPFLGPTARVAAVSRFGIVSGRTLASGTDAILNTAIFGVITAPLRASQGQPVSIENLLLEVATAGIIGSVFGGIGGALRKRRIGIDHTALAEIEVSRQNLDDAVTSHIETGEIRARPETLRKVEGIAAKQTFAPRVLGDTTVEAPAGVPIDISFDDFVRQVVIDTDLELSVAVKQSVEKLDKAEAKLADAEIKLEKAEVTSVRNKDPVSGDILDTIDARLKENIPARERIDLTRQRDNLLASIGVREADVTSGPAKAIRNAEKSVATARRDVAVVQRDVDARVVQQDAIAKALRQPKTDGFVPPPDPSPVEAATALPRVKSGPATAADVADEVDVDLETGDFAQLDEFEVLRAQGRLTPEEISQFDNATKVVEKSKNYADALRQAAICEVG